MARDGTATAYTYGATGQLLTATTTGHAALTAAWDPYGDLTSAPDPGGATSTGYSYDLAGRLTGVTPSSGSAYALTLDALGRPATRLTGGASTETYSYALSSDAAVSTGTVSAAVDGSGSLDAESAAGALTFTLPDLHGDVAGWLGPTLASVAGAYRYDPYGEQVASGGSAPSPWRYQGRLLLSGGSAQDTYDLGARAYAPALGAFTSMDTVAGSAQDPLSLNRFLYAEADPATLSDPTGHSVVLMDEAGSTLTHDRTTARTVRLASASRLRAARQAERRLAAQRAARAAWAARVDRRTGESASARADAQSAQARASLDRARTASAARVAARTGYGTDEAAAASQAAADDARESASLARTAPAGPASGGGGWDPLGTALMIGGGLVLTGAAVAACVALCAEAAVAAAGVITTSAVVDAVAGTTAVACAEYCGEVADDLEGSGQAAVDEGASAGASAVNALGGTLNCVACAIAGDSTLGGNPASALDVGPQNVSAIQRILGVNTPWQPVSGREQVAEILQSAGNGARGIVWGQRASGFGHVFNAVTQRGAVNFVDFQSGSEGSFDGFSQIRFLLTSDGG